MCMEFITEGPLLIGGLGENREKNMKIAARGEIKEGLFWRPEQGVK